MMWSPLDFEHALAARDDRLAEAMHGEHAERAEPRPTEPRARTAWDDILDARPAGPTWPEPF